MQAVFTDLNMPVMNGMQLLREMAKRDSWKNLLRIIISTDGSKLRREEARELNVNLYVEKAIPTGGCAMSCAKSPALNPSDLHDALQTALIEVSENAYFVFVEPADRAQFADAVNLVKDAWLKVSVVFEGSFAGAVEIVMEPLGMWLVTSPRHAGHEDSKNRSSTASASSPTWCAPG